MSETETVEGILAGVEAGIAEVEGEMSAVEQAKQEYDAMLAEPGLEQREVQIEVMEKFTEAQLADKGQQLAGVLMEIVAEDEEFAAQRDTHKLRKKGFEETRDKLRDEIENGQGLVKVNAIETFVPKARKAITRDLEGKILKERSLSEDELADRNQMSLAPMSEDEVAENAKAFGLRNEDEPLEEEVDLSGLNDPDPELEVETETEVDADDLDESTEEELERARERVRNGSAKIPAV